MSDPYTNVNLYTTPHQMSVIGLDELNNANVVPLHIIGSNISSEEGIPHIYITEGAIPLLIGTENDVKVNIENQGPAQIKTISAEYPYPHFNLSNTKRQLPELSMVRQLPNHAQTMKTLSLPNTNQTQQNQTKYVEVIPNSSKRYAINEQIQLLHPLSQSSISLLNQNELHTSYSINLTKPISSLKEQPTSNLSNLINETDIKFLLKQQISAHTENNPVIEDNSQALTPKTKADLEIPERTTDQYKTTVRKHIVQNYIHISDQRVPQRAVAVMPSTLQLRGKQYIFSRRTLPARIRFGPVEGVKKIVNASQAHSLITKKDSPVFLLKNDNEIIHIDVSDRDKCNWMGLLPVGLEGEANVWLYQQDDELFAITTEPISARKPLKLGYSKKYAEDHRLLPGLPTLDIETVLTTNPQQWWCNECNRALPSASVLQRHSELYHKDDVISTRRGYRCLTCRRTFSRLFTLRRHISKHCPKKHEKPPPPKEDIASLNTSIDLNSTLINEESKIPSDESFQNFTNGLDFTSSLFDTDRMSNIDISANSRVDDFNPYDITFKDDTCTSNDLSLSKLTDGTINIISNIEVKNKSPSHKCSYCSQVVRKGNRRKHKNECPLKRLECTCGKIFRNKEKLVQHFLEDHPTDNPPKTNLKLSDKNTCDLCKPKRVSFKRRGMLVNHLWRAHKTVSTTKVERPVKHYPCVACPKIYRSAAKRDQHIKVHHPGAEKLRAQSIQSGMRACEPAACDICPRQYATRAKLLQHVRKHHPLAAQEITKKKKAKLQPTMEMEKQHCNNKVPSYTC